MRLHWCAPVLVSLLAFGCRAPEPPPTPEPKTTPGPQPQPPIPPATPQPGSVPTTQPAGQQPQSSTAPRKFGEPITKGDALALSSVLAKPDQFANQTVTVQAKVRRNCTRRGCWMELSEALDPTLPGCRVTFKDYGFFVPLDSAGSTAKVQGVVQVQSVAPPEVAHLESEGAKFAAKQPDGSAREVRLVATGVELWRDAS